MLDFPTLPVLLLLLLVMMSPAPSAWRTSGRSVSLNTRPSGFCPAAATCSVNRASAPGDGWTDSVQTSWSQFPPTDTANWWAASGNWSVSSLVFALRGCPVCRVRSDFYLPSWSLVGGGAKERLARSCRQRCRCATGLGSCGSVLGCGSALTQVPPLRFPGRTSAASRPKTGSAPLTMTVAIWLPEGWRWAETTWCFRAQHP